MKVQSQFIVDCRIIFRCKKYHNLDFRFTILFNSASSWLVTSLRAYVAHLIILKTLEKYKVLLKFNMFPNLFIYYSQQFVFHFLLLSFFLLPSLLFYFTLLSCFLFYSNLFYSLAFYSILFYSILFYFILLSPIIVSSLLSKSPHFFLLYLDLLYLLNNNTTLTWS